MGLGTPELIIIAFVVVLLFGGKRLPQLGKSMGSAITNFKKGLNESNAEKKSEEESDSNSKPS